MIIQIKDGQKNCTLLVKGIVQKGGFEAVPILDIGKLTAPSAGWKGLRLDSAVWAIQEKMGLALWWKKPEGEEDLVFPMESRNAMRFEEGIPSPRVEAGWGGRLYLTCFNSDEGSLPKRFMVLVDFDKQ